MAKTMLPSVNVGSGSDDITLLVAEDAFQGDAEFTVSVDGTQIGGTQTALAQNANNAEQAFNIMGNFGAGPHTVTVDFLNDAYAGPGQDRNLYVLGATVDGDMQDVQPLSLLGDGPQSLQVSSGPVVVGSGRDTIALAMAEDAYDGDAQFTVSVDGQQIGGTQTVTALASSGQIQTFNVMGNFGAGSHTVAIDFLNDAYGGPGQDRNLYLGAATFDGAPQANSSLALSTSGTQSITVTSGPAIVGSGRDTIALAMAEDAYNGDAQFTVTVDGQQIGGVQTALASHASGQSQTFDFEGNFGSGTHVVGVDFLNDAYGGAGLDRNLYLLSATFDGNAVPNGSLNLYGNGTQTIAVQPGPTTIGAGPDTIGLQVTEDAYDGDAQFTVSIDGKQIGGVQTATALNGTDTPQVFNVMGAFGPGTHTVSVDFLNDAYGGPGEDRNLYVVGSTFNGVTQYLTGATLLSSGVQSFQVREPTTNGFSLLGVNLSGAEYGSTTSVGTVNTDYIMPSPAEMDYYASKGMDVFRLPLMWERLQPTQGGPLNQTYLAQIDQTVNYANSKGIKVDLDIHDYGQGYGNTVGSSGTPTSSLVNLWTQLAGHYANNSNVMFGIMNEPYVQDATTWATIENQVVQAIRGTGAHSQEILASGTAYDTGVTWDGSGNASALASLVHDPYSNMAFEVHQYFNQDSSGTTSDIVSPMIGVQRLADVTNWAEQNGFQLFLGEFGVPPTSDGLAALNNTLAYMQQHNDVWQGGTAWEGGQWVGGSPMALDPVNGKDMPQIPVLQQYTR